MTGNFFETLSAEEKRRMKERMATLTDMMTEWVKHHPLVRTLRIPPVALLVAAVAPRLSLPDALLATKMIFWIFELDDLSDGRLIPLAEVRQRTENWYHLAREGSNNQTQDDDELAAILLEIRADLSKSDLFEPLREDWATQVRLLAEGMAQEYQYGLQYSADRMHALPSLDEYLYYSTNSFGFPAWALTLLIALNDPSTLDGYESLNAAFQCAGTALRLYNDDWTLDKELQEGNINAVVILYHALPGGNSDVSEERVWTELRQRVRHLADEYAQRNDSLVAKIQTASGLMEEIILRTVAFHAYFYSSDSGHDYHTTSAADTIDMVDGRRNSAQSFDTGAHLIF